MEYYLSIKRNGLLIYAIQITLSEKKPISKADILHDYMYTTFLKWQNYINGGQISGNQRLWVAGVGGGSRNKYGYKGCHGLNVYVPSPTNFYVEALNLNVCILEMQVFEVN